MPFDIYEKYADFKNKEAEQYKQQKQAFILGKLSNKMNEYEMGLLNAAKKQFNKEIEKSITLTPAQQEIALATYVAEITKHSDLVSKLNLYTFKTHGKVQKSLVKLPGTANAAAFNKSGSGRPELTAALTEATFTKNKCGFFAKVTGETVEDALETLDLDTLLKTHWADNQLATIEWGIINATSGTEGFDGLIADSNGVDQTTTATFNKSIVPTVQMLASAAAKTKAKFGKAILICDNALAYDINTDVASSELLKEMFDEVIYMDGIFPTAASNTTYAIVVDPESIVLGLSEQAQLSSKYKLDEDMTRYGSSMFVDLVSLQAGSHCNVKYAV